MYPESLGGGPMYPQTWWDIWGGGYCIPKSGGGHCIPKSGGVFWQIIMNMYVKKGETR